MTFSTNTIAFFAASLALFAVGYPAAAIESHQSDDFHVIGTINNKTFYTPKNDTTMNWMSADGLCRYFGLELATFKTREEFSFVRYNLPENHYQLWVSAALKGLMPMLQPVEAFEWQDGSSIDIGYLHIWTAHDLCVYFSQDDHLFTDFCVDGRHKPLCQTVSANSTSVTH